MPAVLREHQHEISTLDGDRSLLFGTEDTGYLTLERPTYATADIRTSDKERPQEDGVMWGRDYLGSKSVTFEVGVLTDKINGLDNGDPHRANLDHLDTLEGWWHDERLRDSPRAMAVLRSHEAGQTWRAYGRPREYEESAGKLTALGYTPIVCTFRLIDDRYYSDTVQQVEAELAPDVEGGIVFPLISAGNTLFATTRETVGSSVAIVAGGRATWPWVEFTGPVLNPNVAIGDNLYLGLLGSVPAGMSATVDTRPWSRSVTRSDGANLAGMLDPRGQPLRRCLLYPGTQDVVYSGSDATGSSRAIVRWRDARNRP